jgi:hypothetical protein
MPRRRRPTRAELADRARLDWLCERTEAELETCEYCQAPPSATCRDPRTGRPLVRQTAHLARIRARARRTARRAVGAR